MAGGSPLGRVVEIAEEGRHLAKHRGFLTVSSGQRELGRIPLDDISAVIATARGTTLSTALIAALAERGAPLVLCGANFAPTALVFPIGVHHAQQRRMEAQMTCPRPLAHRLWRQVAAAKLRMQGCTLAECGHPHRAFIRLAGQVRAGDPANLEAQAARRYWKLLLGADFRRDPVLPGTNALLNYGYAVLRGSVARAIAAAGLHPGVGIFHRHPQNPLPLADDLMEPFRPVIDAAVMRLHAEGIDSVTVEVKRALAGVLEKDLDTDAGHSPLATCLLRSAQSLADSFLIGAPALVFPLTPQLRRKQVAGAAEGFGAGRAADGEDDGNVSFGLSDHVAVRDVRPAGDDEA